MTQVQILPPAAKFLKKLKDKKLKSLYKEAIEMICEDYSIGEEKTGDLAGMYGYDIYYNKYFQGILLLTKFIPALPSS